MSSEMKEKMTLDQVRAELKGAKAKSIGVRSMSWPTHPNFRLRWRRISFGGTGVDRSRFAPRLHEADGRVDGAGWPGRLHQAADERFIPTSRRLKI